MSKRKCPSLLRCHETLENIEPLPFKKAKTTETTGWDYTIKDELHKLGDIFAQQQQAYLLLKQIQRTIIEKSTHLVTLKSAISEAKNELKQRLEEVADFDFTDVYFADDDELSFLPVNHE